MGAGSPWLGSKASLARDVSELSREQGHAPAAQRQWPGRRGWVVRHGQDGAQGVALQVFHRHHDLGIGENCLVACSFTDNLVGWFMPACPPGSAVETSRWLRKYSSTAVVARPMTTITDLALFCSTSQRMHPPSLLEVH